MPPAMFQRSAKPLSGRYLSLAEREEIAILRAQDLSVRDIARQIGRIGFDGLARAAAKCCDAQRRLGVSGAPRRNGMLSVRHDGRNLRSWRPTRRCGPTCKNVWPGWLRALTGCRSLGRSCRGKDADMAARQSRRWAAAWSPEQIARRLRLDFPGDETMRISHEAIYQSLYVQGRGALRRELTACLRTGRALRVPRARSRGRGKAHVGPEVLISERPAEVGDRAVPGHWEGDLILGLGSSAIGTLVERTTRFTMLLHLPRMPEHGCGLRDEERAGARGSWRRGGARRDRANDHDVAEAAAAVVDLGSRGRDGQHAQLRIDTGLQVYFCDPHSPWQRGTNENTNGLLRQYFPKGTDLCLHSADELAAVRWRSTHGHERRCAGEHLRRCLTKRSFGSACVATTV